MSPYPTSANCFRTPVLPGFGVSGVSKIERFGHSEGNPRIGAGAIGIFERVQLNPGAVVGHSPWLALVASRLEARSFERVQTYRYSFNLHSGQPGSTLLFERVQMVLRAAVLTSESGLPHLRRDAMHRLQ